MKLLNFELVNIDLTLEDEVYDLHNNFDFCGFSYNVTNRTLILNWSCGHGDWVPSGMPSEIIITISNVSHLSAEARDVNMPYTEDDCLDCVSFVEPDQPAEKCFITEGPANDNLHYVFQFMSGFILRVQAEDAVCKVSKGKNSDDDERIFTTLSFNKIMNEIKLKSSIMILSGWLLFILCLFLPAATKGSESLSGFDYGWSAIMLIPKLLNEPGWPAIVISGLGNILSAFSLIIIIFKNKIILTIFSTIFFVLFINNSYYFFTEMTENIDIGYYVWVVSYVFLFVGSMYAIKEKNA